MAGQFPEREFGQLGSQSRLAKIARAKKTDYWGGITWVFQVTIVNDGSNAGSQTTIISPGEGNEFEIMYGHIFNGDTSSRGLLALIQDGFDVPALNFTIAELSRFNVGVNDTIDFPSVSTTNLVAGGHGGRYIVSGTMVLVMQAQSIGVNQDSRHSVALRCRVDEEPTVTFDIPSGAVATVNTRGFFG